MSDADPTANGYPPRAESAPSDLHVPADISVPEFLEAAETGEPGYEYPAQPGSGGASAWPAWPGAARPAGWFLSVPREAAPLGTPGMEPARPDNRLNEPDEAEYQEYQEYADDAEHPEYDEYQYPGADDARPYDNWPHEPVVGPTEALRGRAGGPGFRVPAGSGYGLRDATDRSGWQIADGLWRDCGISWDSADGRTPEQDAPWTGQPRDASPPPQQAFPLGAPTTADAPTRPEALAPQTITPPVTPAPEAAIPPPAGPLTDDLPRRAARPLRPEVPPLPRPGQAAPRGTARAPFPARDIPQYASAQQAPALPPQPAGPGEWRSRYDRQAWDDQQSTPRHPYQRRQWEDPQSWEEPTAVPAFPARRRARGRKAWQVVRIGVPVGVIVAVGAGALVMLTGKTHEVLGPSGNQSPASPGTTATTSKAGAGPLSSTSMARPAPLAFPGYPGKQGSESVNSIASAGGVQVAVGTAGGQAAIWRRDNGGAWSLMTGANAVTQEPAGTTLTSVAHGQAGWLAVGDVSPVPFGGSGTAKAPVVLTSADGRTWHAVTGSSAAFA